jgi:sugar/nucleoside kinase (ribokinase family)
MPLEDVFDPTGAGDTFAGGFMGYIARTGDTSFQNMKHAVIFGSALASFTVEKFGTDKLTELSIEDIQKRIQEFSELVDFKI